MHGQMTSAFYPTPEKTEVTLHFPPPPFCNPLKRARFLVAEFQDERTERGLGTRMRLSYGPAATLTSPLWFTMFATSWIVTDIIAYSISQLNRMVRNLIVLTLDRRNFHWGEIESKKWNEITTKI